MVPFSDPWILSASDADRLMDRVLSSASRIQGWMARQTGEPLELLRSMRFDPTGRDPLDERPITFSEQIGRTWVYAVAIEAARTLLAMHPDAGGFDLASSSCQTEISVVSRRSGFVRAETFVGGAPRNSRKIKTSGNFLDGWNVHEYVFFHSPDYRVTARQPQFNRRDVQVCSVEILGREDH